MSAGTELQRRLLEWYGRARRDLPWRRQRDPYAIWVSEVMLQQTQVATALPYYERWMRRFPDLASLAGADEADVLHAWQGLGYYSRAKNLQRAARQVLALHGGRLPEDVHELCQLPGVGRYTAGAIASIAFDKPVPVVDGNVMRVLCRVFGLRGDPRKPPLAGRLWQLAAELVPERAAADFNQAVMELGATLCTPAKPRCQACPISADCEARRRGLAHRLPELAKRPPPTQLRMLSLVLERRGRVLLGRLAASAPRWAGMWQFPTLELGPSDTAGAAAKRAGRELLGLHVEAADPLCTLRHSVTRYRITLEAVRARARGSAQAKVHSELCWTLPAELADLAMPSAQRRVAEAWVAQANGRGPRG